jgi:Trk K+ transport system NAD-binding subunit
MQIQPGSAVDGLSIERARLRRLAGSYLSAIERAGTTMEAVEPDEILRSNDRLVFMGLVGTST